MERLHASFKSGTRYEQMHKTGIKKEAKVMVRRDNPLSSLRLPTTPCHYPAAFSHPCLAVTFPGNLWSITVKLLYGVHIFLDIAAQHPTCS